MCTTNIYTYVYPDGRREQYSQPTLCANSRHNQVCAQNYRLDHPPTYVSAYDAPAFSYTSQLPPTPQYSPAPSTPSGSHRSGDESDRSYSSSNSKKDRSSGVYVNGQKVLDLNRKRRGSRHHQERIVLVDSPASPRTPPQQWSAPASPNGNTYMVDSSRDSNHRRPVIVDERTLQPERRVQIEVVDNHHHRSKHHRHASSSSKESRNSNEDEERRRRRHEEKRQQEKEKLLQKRIAEANQVIASRPVAAAPLAPKRSATYKRPSVEIPVDQMRRLSFEEERRDDKARRLARREEKKEEEAQRERLRERMQPKRRLTVGADTRRPTDIYEPMYRYQ
ncbi:hypothetical protein NXS19_011461 [Fusarium pseudograminearum]|uniref:Uncharacterized protein n=1 Tax=Fusarium pseudograminearum (strain CS3096) TaxID=1028729 RepID=K3VSG1_FUSPC|nr:hypothetical protein FPSE_01695 [Fusarium pseudograminearum CS3096]EKJ78234.1 hypothetical protein FPSE_01695 [Fusarium pseudograminearum CS3096]UZP43649.1 hypothetical protein NXS19_011461 [Fusarium pseudograminearum]